MSTLLAMTTSDAEFAIEYSVSTQASSCRKDREPGAGEGSSAGLEGRGASGDGAEAWRDEGIVTAWLGWMFCAIEYGGWVLGEVSRHEHGLLEAICRSWRRGGGG